MDAPGLRQAATASALNAAVCVRRRRRPDPSCIVYSCPRTKIADTIILRRYPLAKVSSPAAYSDWDELVKEAAVAADLPGNTCLYTLRHSFITQALLDGVSTLEVSKIVGTSLPMIEKHYGHLVFDRAAERLAKVQIV